MSADAIVENDISTKELEEKSKKAELDDAGADDGISSGSSLDGLDGEAQESKSTAAEGWEDILGSNELFRKVLKPGTGDRKPTSGDLVKLRVEGKLENGQTVDCSDSLTFVLGHSEVIPAFDLCVPFMKLGEIDAIRTSARFAYGEAGKEDEIPPDASIIYEIELLDIENGPNIEELSVDERLAWIEKKKQRGNYYFQREEFTSAIDVYDRALKLLEANPGDTEEDRQRLTVANATLHNNLAAAQLKVGAWNAAIKSLRVCTFLQPDNVKAHFRMAKAYMGQGNYENAKVKLAETLALDPTNKAIQAELSRASFLLKQENEKSKAVYRRMFNTSNADAKGNSVLSWVKEHCTLTNGAIMTAAAVGVAFIFRYFSEPKV